MAIEFSAEQVAAMEDRVAHLVQRPLHVLRELAMKKPVSDRLLLQGLDDLEGLIAWIRSLR